MCCDYASFDALVVVRRPLLIATAVPEVGVHCTLQTPASFFKTAAKRPLNFKAQKKADSSFDLSKHLAISDTHRVVALVSGIERSSTPLIGRAQLLVNR